MSNIELKGLQGLSLLLENEKHNINSQSFLNVPITSLVPCPFQPRKKFKAEEMNELAESIKAQGLIQPIVVRKLSKTNYEIIAGERRWRAAQIAKLQNVPVICRNVNDATVLAFSLIENIQRQDLNVIEEAHAIKTMIDKFSYTQEDVARMLGKGRSTITNLLRILHLNPLVVDMLINESLELGHAKLLLSLMQDQQLIVANTIAAKNLSVRETEKLLNSIKMPDKQLIPQYEDANETLNLWQKRLSESLHSKVNILLNSNGKGRVVIHVESRNEIEWLVKKLE